MAQQARDRRRQLAGIERPVEIRAGLGEVAVQQRCERLASRRVGQRVLVGQVAQVDQRVRIAPGRQAAAEEVEQQVGVVGQVGGCVCGRTPDRNTASGPAARPAGAPGSGPRSRDLPGRRRPPRGTPLPGSAASRPADAPRAGSAPASPAQAAVSAAVSVCVPSPAGSALAAGLGRCSGRGLPRRRQAVKTPAQPSPGGRPGAPRGSIRCACY